MDYLDRAIPAPIAPLLDVLDLTGGNPSWGLLMRRGTVEVTARDFALIAHEMGADSLVG